MATKIDNHVEQALSRLRQQFKDKPNIETWISILVAPMQRLEDALYQLLTERGIDDAVGAQLDRLGKIVGQPRDGRTDETYRRFIRARISVNTSNGTIEDVLTVTRLVLDDDDITLTLGNSGPACLLFQLEDSAVPVDTALLLAVYFLRRTVAAGVRIVTESGATNPDDWARWGDDWNDSGKFMIGAYS